MPLQPCSRRYVVSQCEVLHSQIRELAISALFFPVHLPEVMVILALRQQSVLRGLVFQKLHLLMQTMH